MLRLILSMIFGPWQRFSLWFITTHFRFVCMCVYWCSSVRQCSTGNVCWIPCLSTVVSKFAFICYISWEMGSIIPVLSLTKLLYVIFGTIFLVDLTEKFQLVSVNVFGHIKTNLLVVPIVVVVLMLWQRHLHTHTQQQQQYILTDLK